MKAVAKEKGKRRKVVSGIKNTNSPILSGKLSQRSEVLCNVTDLRIAENMGYLTVIG
jgi:hypothetical protein